MYHSDVMPSEKLLEMGLVNRVVEDDDLLTEALAYARKVAAGPPLAASEIRRLLHSSLDATGSAEQWLIQEWNAQASLLKTTDAKEGFRSFVERRDPDFRGY
jgi:enoyl-CoA hydratase/carnithine racemase